MQVLRWIIVQGWRRAKGAEKQRCGSNKDERIPSAAGMTAREEANVRMGPGPRLLIPRTISRQGQGQDTV